MTQKPLPKIYDRPERKLLSPALLAMIIAFLVVVSGFVTYYWATHRAASAPVGGATPVTSAGSAPLGSGKQSANQ